MNAVVALILLLHGLVHGWYIVLSRRWVAFQPDMGWSGRSWLLSGAVSKGAASWLATVLFGLAGLAFLVAGSAQLVRADWARWALLSAALLSSTTIILFWDGEPTMLVQKGALGLAINAAVLVLLTVGR